MNPFQVVKDFESELAKYTGAPFAVTTTSCTMALLLAMAYHFRGVPHQQRPWIGRPMIEIPRRTYVGVPMSIVHAGGRPTFRDEDWVGAYQLKPLPVWDCARIFTSGMYSHQEEAVRKGMFQCVSFHWNKTLGIQQGGAILHADPIADEWLRLARFDGRAEGVAPKDQAAWPVIGWHAYLAPETAAAGLVRLASLPRENLPLPWDDYPDLSTLALFK